MTEINNRIEEVKKILREALWMAYCSGRANNKYIPEEVLPDLMKRCQLFPQPLDEGLKVLVGGEWVEASKELKNTARSIEQALQRKPLDDKELREKALLTKEEREKCVPSEGELSEYLAIPDDTVATELRKRLPETDFRELGLLILYNEKCIKAQQDKDFALLQPKIEEAKVGEARDIIKCVTDAKRVHPNWKAEDIIDLLTFREETREAMKNQSGEWVSLDEVKQALKRERR